MSKFDDKVIDVSHRFSRGPRLSIPKVDDEELQAEIRALAKEVNPRNNGGRMGVCWTTWHFRFKWQRHFFNLHVAMDSPQNSRLRLWEILNDVCKEVKEGPPETSYRAN